MKRISYYNPNIKFDRKALKEVWEILKEYEDGIEEIPEKYMWITEDNMDKDYEFDVENVEAEDFREDTKKILTFLYTNYLSTPEERKVLKQLEEMQIKEMQACENKQQEIEYPMFKKEEKSIENIEESNNTNLPVEYKESIFKNIINKIKEFFNGIFGK